MSEKYLNFAKKYLGTKEVVGNEANPQIVEFDKHTTLKATSDEVPWCSAFANFVVDSCGDKGTESAAARSWLTWGKEIKEPAAGCIVVLDRSDTSNKNAAHVTFFEREVDSSHISCLGGNQSDMVKVSVYAKSKVLGYRDIC
jgi:uncharacterized protein (TIGR02594 family)